MMREPKARACKKKKLFLDYFLIALNFFGATSLSGQLIPWFSRWTTSCSHNSSPDCVLHTIRRVACRRRACTGGASLTAAVTCATASQCCNLCCQPNGAKVRCVLREHQLLSRSTLAAPSPESHDPDHQRHHWPVPPTADHVCRTSVRRHIVKNNKTHTNL